MNDIIYLRGLRYVNHTVFCVEKTQKTYWDNYFKRTVPYSSGQQVKRCIIESVLGQLKLQRSPLFFGFEVDGEGKKNLKEDVVLSYCDPRHVDLLLAGWLNTNRKSKIQIDEANPGADILNYFQTLKRTSPLSISAMLPIHPYAASITAEQISVDRRSDADDQFIFITDEDENVVNCKKPYDFLDEFAPSQFHTTKYIEADKNLRVTGMFRYDVAIDLRTLFTVSLSPIERSITEKTEAALRADGWLEHQNQFGPCLLCPDKKRNEIIPALAYSLINWQITSNQSRTFGLPTYIAFAITDQAWEIPEMIRTELSEQDSRQGVSIILDEAFKDKLFVTRGAKAFIDTDLSQPDAIKKAEQRLIQIFSEYNY